MKVIVGLGNPGNEYEKTRHNAGFLVLDEVSKALGISIKTKKFNALMGETFVRGEKVVFVKPQTYMNLSGDAVMRVMDYYGIEASDLLVVSDDLDLPVGRLRLREQGSSGGQKGIQDIINKLGTNHFLRLKVGIGNNKLMDTKDYVLGKMDKDTAIKEASQCVLDFLEGKTILELMNQYN